MADKRRDDERRARRLVRRTRCPVEDGVLPCRLLSRGLALLALALGLTLVGVLVLLCWGRGVAIPRGVSGFVADCATVGESVGAWRAGASARVVVLADGAGLTRLRGRRGSGGRPRPAPCPSLPPARRRPAVTTGRRQAPRIRVRCSHPKVPPGRTPKGRAKVRIAPRGVVERATARGVDVAPTIT